MIKNQKYLKLLKLLLREPWLIPDKIPFYVLGKVMKNRLFNTMYFGWFQAIFWPFEIDGWHRYSSIAQQINSIQFVNPINILDVGGGQGNIKSFLDPNKYNITVYDLNIHSLEKIRDSRITAIHGDACCMALKDNSFDIAVSCDSLEHVSDTKKKKYCLEMKRVAKSYVIIHCPSDSADSNFQGTTCDIKFQQWYRNHFKRDESNTTEHLNSGLPRIDDLHKIFPGAIIVGKQNSEVWLSYMKKGSTPYIRYINGLVYKLHLQKLEDMPPYRACLLVWRKE
jgi:hypothetical protein